MADWMREIVLQKTYGMGPSEATYWAEREDGLTMVESADLHGVTFYTVRSMIQRAKMKISGATTGESREEENRATRGLDTMIVVCRGVEGNVADSVKYAAISAIMRFVSDVTGAPVFEGRNVAVILTPRRAGDVRWLLSNVFSHVNPQGCNMQQVPAVAAKMRKCFDEAGGDPEKVGTAIIRYWLDQMYMKYDVWSPEAEE